MHVGLLAGRLTYGGPLLMSVHLADIGRERNTPVISLAGNRVAVVSKKLEILMRRFSIGRFLLWLRHQYIASQSQYYGADRLRECGEGVRIAQGVFIDRPDRVILKDHVVINRGTNICALGGLYIGRYCGFGINCTIWTVNHRVHGADALPYDQVAELKPVIIHDYVYVGAGAMILPGVEIGEGAIIGMGSVVTKDVQPLAIVMGNPAKVVFHRDADHFRSLKASKRACLPGIRDYDEHLARSARIRHPRELKELGLM